MMRFLRRLWAYMTSPTYPPPPEPRQWAQDYSEAALAQDTLLHNATHRPRRG